MERITEKTLREVFAHFASVHGWRVSDEDWPLTDPRRDGAVYLREQFGGLWRIEAHCAGSPPRNGEAQTYTAARDITSLMSKRELVGAMRFELAIRSAERFGSVAVASD
jgi:hypothetical protein